MLSALSSKVEANSIVVLDELTLEAPKTKDMINILRNLKTEKKALVVLGTKNDNVVKSVNNIPGVQATFVGEMNVYDILNHGSFVITKEAVEKIEEVYA